MGLGVRAIDVVSGFPDQDNTAEETHQANGVEDSHESLALLVITFEDDEEGHHDGEDSTGGTHNSKISHKVPNPVKLGQQEGSLVVLVKPEGVTACSALSHDSLPVVQVNSEGLSSSEGVDILGQ